MELHITVNLDGTVEIDAVGYSGTKCLEASQPYEKDLGIAEVRKKKPELLSEGGSVANAARNRVNY
ncbi:DUF2997 domain-containing protein [Pelotomaculum propionicicum]|uniref:DUF2997 domain-containing protein n=1 Tax=Pelotomaculum propionicicum TaxID=258475 RepID=UPI003B7EE910